MQGCFVLQEMTQKFDSAWRELTRLLVLGGWVDGGGGWA